LTPDRQDASTDRLDLANTLRGYALLQERLGNYGAAGAMWHEARNLYASLDVHAGVDEGEKRLARSESR